MSVIKVTCPQCSFEYPLKINESIIRSLSQNSLYWGVYIKILSEELGYFPDEMHEELKLKFNAKDSKLTPGEKVGGSTKRMTTKEFTEYLTEIRTWASFFHNISLPEKTQ